MFPEAVEVAVLDAVDRVSEVEDGTEDVEGLGDALALSCLTINSDWIRFGFECTVRKASAMIERYMDRIVPAGVAIEEISIR